MGDFGMLTRKQQELLIFIDDRLKSDGVSPSFEEMKDALNLKSKSGVHRLINALEERSFIRRLPNRARALEVLRLPDALKAEKPALTLVSSRPAPAPPALAPPALAMLAANDTITVPLHGRIAAGLPVEALESDRSLSVPSALLGPGDHYALEVSGDSMIEAGIHDGDYALIRRCDTARDGDIIVALIDDSEATLKYLHHEKGLIRLDPANSSFSPQRYRPEQVRIQGKLAGLLRRYL
jgi:repressor LexA